VGEADKKKLAAIFRAGSRQTHVGVLQPPRVIVDCSSPTLSSTSGSDYTPGT
jgi:hypothetical protein